MNQKISYLPFILDNPKVLTFVCKECLISNRLLLNLNATFMLSGYSKTSYRQLNGIHKFAKLLEKSRNANLIEF